ncbi:YbjN domain-containing protein [Devosia sp.]|uniref:YbjN domain-containing protein n=1 Tax=Devosia sp. TaxID=1871048 RepID=UPI003BAD699F
MTKQKAAIVLSLYLALVSAASAQSILDASNVNEIVTIAKSYGPADLVTRDSGDPRISGTIGGLPYQLFFMNCTDGKACEDINFYAGFTDTKPTLDAINDWNRSKRFGKAYLDSELDAVIEYDVNLEHGVTRDNLDAAFSLWSQLVPEYAAFVGYRSQ